MKPTHKIILFSLLLTTAFSACKEKEEPPKPPVEVPATKGNLTFKFESQYAGVPINWNTFYKTMAGDTVKFAKVKYLFSNFVLEKTNGDLVKIPDAYGFLSLSENIDSFTLKDVPFGDYKSLRIMVGVDSVINHGNPSQWPLTHPLCPSVNDMFWSWSGGYIFNVVEGYFKNNNADVAFSFHVALDKNIRKNVLNYNYNFSKNSTFTLKVETYSIFSNVIFFSLKSDGSFSHSGDPDPVMDKFLLNSNGIISIKDFK